MAQNFINAGGKIFPQPEGLTIQLQGGKVYNLKYDEWMSKAFFTEDGELNMPAKLYNSEADEKFMNRVINYYKSATGQTTGVLLNGTKGTGKTVMAKEIAIKSGLPIIVVSEGCPTSAINDLYKQITEETVLIFDEIDKKDNRWREDGLLRFLDGVQSTSKKLVIMTSNDSDKMSQYLFDRCSRIRYIRHFKAEDNAKFLLGIFDDKDIITNHELLKNFMSNNIALLSIDNILSFIQEVKLYEDSKGLTEPDLFYLLEDMNITGKKNSKSDATDTITKIANMYISDPDAGTTGDIINDDDEDDDDEEYDEAA